MATLLQQRQLKYLALLDYRYWCALSVTAIEYYNLKAESLKYLGDAQKEVAKQEALINGTLLSMKP